MRSSITGKNSSPGSVADPESPETTQVRCPSGASAPAEPLEPLDPDSRRSRIAVHVRRIRACENPHGVDRLRPLGRQYRAQRRPVRRMRTRDDRGSVERAPAQARRDHPARQLRRLARGDTRRIDRCRADRDACRHAHDLGARGVRRAQHVFVEKPMTASVRRSAHAGRAGAKRDRVLMVDHTYVFSPAVQRSRRRSRAARSAVPWRTSRRATMRGGVRGTRPFIGTSPHDLAILGHLFANGPHEIAATRLDGGQAGESTGVRLVLAYRNRSPPPSESSWTAPAKARRVAIAGTAAASTTTTSRRSARCRCERVAATSSRISTRSSRCISAAPLRRVHRRPRRACRPTVGRASGRSPPRSRRSLLPAAGTRSMSHPGRKPRDPVRESRQAARALRDELRPGGRRGARLGRIRAGAAGGALRGGVRATAEPHAIGVNSGTSALHLALRGRRARRRR